MKLLKRLFLSKPDRHYVSELDRFLENLKKKNPYPSASQQKVLRKYERLIKLRDKGQETPSKVVSWDKF